MIPTSSGDDSMAVLLRATAFAAHKHRNQRRKDLERSPYINHPIAVAMVLVEEGGIRDAAVLAAALLHDTIEDTETTPEELSTTFGAEISEIVQELTDDKRLPKDERKRLQIEHAATASPQAKLVKLGDKICNLRDIVATPPHDWSEARKREYFLWASQVVAGCRGVNSRLEQVFDSAMSHCP